MMTRHQDSPLHPVMARQSNIVTLMMICQGNPVHNLANNPARTQMTNPCLVNRARQCRNLPRDRVDILEILMMTVREVSSLLLVRGVGVLKGQGIPAHTLAMMAQEASNLLLAQGVDDLRDLDIPVHTLATEASNPNPQRDRGILNTARTVQEVDIQVETTLLLMMTLEGNPQLARRVGPRQVCVPGHLGIRVPTTLQTPEVEGRGVRTQFQNSLKDRGN
mmetsp:Transcript_56/g.70  ORF Transcript_56/g.70 Transcript_56/m.70 type:complete len:220 (+) Transcript_56:1924-2583(+)